MDNKALEKIKKCLELTNSTNPNEAANAIKLAAGLMRKYGLVDSDLKHMDMDNSTSRSIVPKKQPEYLSDLVHAINSNYSTIAVFKARYNNRTHNIEWNVCFMGEKNSSMLAAYTFDVLYRKLKKARLEYVKKLHHRLKRINKTIRADSYCQGWVNQVINALPVQFCSEEFKLLLESYRDSLFPKLSDLKELVRKPGRDLDYWQGRRDASHVELHDPLNGQESLKLNHQT